MLGYSRWPRPNHPGEADSAGWAPNTWGLPPLAPASSPCDGLRRHLHLAGELRTIDISKQTPFCPVRNLGVYAGEVFGRLRSADWLRGLPRDEFVRAAAELDGDINALHPFRDGNGRTRRTFLSQLSADAGWHVSWAGMSAEENRAASIKSFLGDNAPLERMIDRLVRGSAG